MYIGRIVTLLTPVFAGLSGWLCQWVAVHLPGTPAIDEAEVTAIFIAGATAAVGIAVTWIRGLQKHEEREAIADLDVGVLPPGE